MSDIQELAIRVRTLIEADASGCDQELLAEDVLALCAAVEARQVAQTEWGITYGDETEPARREHDKDRIISWWQYVSGTDLLLGAKVWRREIGVWVQVLKAELDELS